MRILDPIVSGSLTVTGSTIITGSLNVSAGITGSLQGTASWAINTATASYFSGTVTSASYVVDFQHTQTGFSGNYLMPVQIYQTTAMSGLIGDSVATRYYPFIPSSNIKIASIGAITKATSVPGTGSVRLGIYNSVDATAGGGPTKLPGTLLIDAGLASNTNGTASFVEIAISAVNQPTLQKGVVYWATISPSGSNTSAPGPNNNVTFNNFLGWSSVTGTGMTPAIGINVAVDAATGLPATANTGSYTFIGSTNVKPWPVLRLSGSSV